MACDLRERTGTTLHSANTPQAFITHWEGTNHLSGRARTQRVNTPEGRRYRAYVDEQLVGVYVYRKHARAACSQKLRRLGLKAGTHWNPRVVEIQGRAS
jgi:hypothetical protein